MVALVMALQQVMVAGAWRLLEVASQQAKTKNNQHCGMGKMRQGCALNDKKQTTVEEQDESRGSIQREQARSAVP